MTILKNRIPIFAGLVVLPLLLAIMPVKHFVLFAYNAGEQSYILLVPAISAALVYYESSRVFSEIPEELHWTQFAALIPGTLLLGLSYVVETASESQFALVAVGLILFWTAGFYVCFGPVSLRRAVFPLGMLLWMIPIPPAGIEWITVTLQKASTELVDVMFQWTGVPVYRSGFFFYLPGQAIEVAKECSGIRSTLSLLFLTCILARETLRGSWRRLVLFLCALPIVVIKNGIRIVTLTLLAIYVDPSFLSGKLHHQGGIVFFLIGLAILMPIISLLRRGEKQTEPQTKAAAGVF